MDKCCDNCKNVNCNTKQSGVKWDNWYTSKDYCSKWEKKKDKIEELQSYIEKEIPSYRISIRALKIIQQLIEKSLEEMSAGPNEINCFDWILD